MNAPRTVLALEFVSDIARQDPIDSGDDCECNPCSYCGVAWASDDYDLALTTISPGPSGTVKPHDEDCLWVRANRIMRS